MSSGVARSVSRWISRDLEMSQFWQNRQDRLQPAVPKESTALPGRKWSSGFFSIGSTQKPLERPYVVRTTWSSTRPRTKHSPRWPSCRRQARGQTSHCTRPSAQGCQCFVGTVNGSAREMGSPTLRRYPRVPVRRSLSQGTDPAPAPSRVGVRRCREDTGIGIAEGDADAAAWLGRPCRARPQQRETAMNGPGPIAAGRYSHDLLLHDCDDDLVASTRAFVELGLASGGQVLVHSSQERVAMLREALGSHPRLDYGLDRDLY